MRGVDYVMFPIRLEPAVAKLNCKIVQPASSSLKQGAARAAVMVAGLLGWSVVHAVH
jgi:hypothetical protein